MVLINKVGVYLVNENNTLAVTCKNKLIFNIIIIKILIGSQVLNPFRLQILQENNKIFILKKYKIYSQFL